MISSLVVKFVSFDRIYKNKFIWFSGKNINYLGINVYHIPGCNWGVSSEDVVTRYDYLKL